ncbi:mitochondrial protein Pet127-domain-containing protein [Cyathus striatus]|nr:mitochondrial protein Pet127-domain-containing protein [Cyathus striatus]
MHSFNRAAPRLASNTCRVAAFSHSASLLSPATATAATPTPNAQIASRPPAPRGSPVADRLRKISKPKDHGPPSERVAAVLDKLRDHFELDSKSASPPSTRKLRVQKIKAHKLKAKDKSQESAQRPKNETRREGDRIPLARGAVGTKDVAWPRKDVVHDSWGPDTLAPQEKEWDTPERRRPPHQFEYSKQIEGSVGASTRSGPVLREVKPDLDSRPIATLSHGLDRDPHSGIYNFSPWLEKIPNVNDFSFKRIKQFVKSSEDSDLRDLAKREGKKFCGSTSSLSGLLSQAYFLISDNKEFDISVLSNIFRSEPKTFSPSQLMPVSILLKHNNGIYAVDSHKPDDAREKNILLWLGTLLEKFLTTSPEEFKNYLLTSPGPIEEEQDPRREAYRFSTSNNFVMRSQLDCVDQRLPGTGVFDLKTRACVPIRMDILNYEESSGYLIRSQYGILESFEREYYDLIRSAFLKYGFQARIGHMDGVLVAYHNTDRIFGFQYISLAEMDERLFGPGKGVGDLVFEKCLGLTESVMEEASQFFPAEDALMMVHTDWATRTMNVYVQPATWEGEEETRPIKQLAVKVTNFLETNLSGREDCEWGYYYFIVVAQVVGREGGVQYLSRFGTRGGDAGWIGKCKGTTDAVDGDAVWGGGRGRDEGILGDAAVWGAGGRDAVFEHEFQDGWEGGGSAARACAEGADGDVEAGSAGEGQAEDCGGGERAMAGMRAVIYIVLT